MIYAPVLIPTLSRYNHFVKCIQTLQENGLAPATELFIGVDYPPSDQYVEGYKAIREYTERGISGFSKVNVIYHTENQGWYANFCELRRMAYERYDRYIFSEDDNVFSKNFLEYMNKCLQKYRDDTDVLAVTGYNYPVDFNLTDANVVRVNTYFSAWGYGIWRDKEVRMNQTISLKYFEQMMSNRKEMSRLRKAAYNQYANFIKGFFGYTDMLIKDEEIRRIDLTYGLYMFFERKSMIFPCVSKVRNDGYDGSGINCSKIEESRFNRGSRAYFYEKQPIDDDKTFGEPVEAAFGEEGFFSVNLKLSSFFCQSRGERIRVNIAYLLYRIFGRKRVVQLVQRMK